MGWQIWDVLYLESRFQLFDVAIAIAAATRSDLSILGSIDGVESVDSCSPSWPLSCSFVDII